MLTHILLLLAFSVAVPVPFQSRPAYDPVGSYQKECPNQEETLDCLYLRALVRQAVIESLETIEYSRDQRGAEEAVAALDLDDEPEIQIAACRILGRFPETAGLRDGLPHLLLSPYPAVQQMAARAMSAHGDWQVSQLGNQWINNHQGQGSFDPYDESPVPSQPARLGIVDYPGAVRFPPAESPISFAWLTSDTPSKAIDFYARKSGKRALGWSEWNQRMEAGLERQQAVFENYLERPEMKEIQKLVEQYSSNQDPKILERIQELQQKLETLSEEMEGEVQDPVTQAVASIDTTAQENASYLVLEEQDGKLKQILVAYPEPLLGKTVVRLIWDDQLYGRSWE